MVGGVMFVTFPLLGYARVSVPFFGGMVGGLLLIAVGMVGFHALQRHAYGRKGGAFFWLVVVGSMLVVLGGVVFFPSGQGGTFCRPRHLWCGWHRAWWGL